MLRLRSRGAAFGGWLARTDFRLNEALVSFVELCQCSVWRNGLLRWLCRKNMKQNKNQRHGNKFADNFHSCSCTNDAPVDKQIISRRSIHRGAALRHKLFPALR